MVFAALMLMPAPAGLTPQGQAALAVMCLAVILWATEALHIAVTGIVCLVLLILVGGVSDIGAALYGFSQPVAYFLIGILTLGMAVHRSGLAERVSIFLMRGAGGSAALLYVQMLFSFAALTFALPSASTRGAILVHIYEQVMERWDISRDHRLSQGGDDGVGFAEPPRLHSPAGGRSDPGGGLRAAGRFLMGKMVRPDERPLLRQPSHRRRASVSCSTAPGSRFRSDSNARFA